MHISRLFVLALLALAAPLAQAVRITPAHSGGWFDPEYDKQGFSFEVLGKAGNGPERTVAVYWYTYDDEGAPVWAVGSGVTDHNQIALTMYRTFGGARPPIQQVADDLQPFADMLFTFSTCNKATADFTMTDNEENGTYHLIRLTQIGATTCTGGMSDEVEPGADPITIVAQLEDQNGYDGAQGSVKFKLRPAYSSLEIDVRKLPEATYVVRVDGEDKGEVEVTINGGGNGIGKGTLTFSSPEAEDQPLLDFDPRGQLIEIVDPEGVTALSVNMPEVGSDESGDDSGDGN